MLIPADDAIQTFTVTGATMYGTYEAQTYIPTYNWFFQGGNMVYAVDDNSCWVNTTRCYINLEGWTPDPSGVKGLTVTFDDDEATGIAIIENGNLNILTGKIYDISGREVQKPTRGIYIIDGKKVMIK